MRVGFASASFCRMPSAFLVVFHRLAVLAGVAKQHSAVVETLGQVALVLRDGRVRFRELLPNHQILLPDCKSLGDLASAVEQCTRRS